MSQIAPILDLATLSPIDREFGRFFARRVAKPDRQLLATIASLVSQARGMGHSCLDLESIAGNQVASDPESERQTWTIPNYEDCRDFLKRQPLVSDGSRPTPLVLDNHRLYLYRYWQAETCFADFIAHAMRHQSQDQDFQTISDPFNLLFGPFETAPDWQAVAAFAAIRGTFTLITGGPGTGKTTAVVRMLAILLQEKRDYRIAIAAPTGKAVARLTESILSQKGHLPEPMQEHLPTQVQTVHRLLAYQPKMDRFGFHSQRKLPYDVVVVDEASMVDMLLMANLVEALPTHCKLILLGDHQQLASVDAGNVLSDLCQGADPEQPHSLPFSQAYEGITQQALPLPVAPVPALRDHLVLLKFSRRFNDATGLGALSKAIRLGQSQEALALLESDQHPDISLKELPQNQEALLTHLQPYLQQYLGAKSLPDLFQAYNQLRLLTGLREGRWGVTGLNQLIEQFLRRKGHHFQGNQYVGRPIIVTKNDYGQQLFNGDIGIVWREKGRPLKAYFPTQTEGFRAVPLLKLPTVESAWALTVHKSQGSEFNEVFLVMPPEEHLLCKRELLYTGLTRARQKATLFGNANQVSYAIEHPTKRFSGLAFRLNHAQQLENQSTS